MTELSPEQVAEMQDARRECAKENRALREQLRVCTVALLGELKLAEVENRRLTAALREQTSPRSP